MWALTTSGFEITDAVRLANTQGDGRAYPDSSTGIYPGTVNLIPNGGGETNATGCQNNQASVISRSTTSPKFGTASFKAVCNDNTRVMSVEWVDLSGNRIAVTAGLPYTFSLFRRDGGGYGKSGQLKILWYDAGGSNISTTTGAVGAIPSAWQADASDRNVVTGTAPANAVSVRLTWTATSNNALNDFYYFDGVQFEQSSFASPYVETNGATASRNGARVQAPSTALPSATQAWCAMRIRVGVASSTGLAGVLCTLSDGSSANRILGRFSGTSFITRNIVGSVTEDASTTLTYAAGDYITVIFAWTATNLLVSINGGAFVSATRSLGIPPGMTTFDIGSSLGSSQAMSDFIWLMYGTGTLTNADATTLNALGNTDPTTSTLPVSSVTMLVWKAETSSAISYTRMTNALTMTVTPSETKKVKCTQALASTVTPSLTRKEKRAFARTSTISPASHYRARKNIGATMTLTPALTRKGRRIASLSFSVAGTLERKLHVHKALSVAVVPAETRVIDKTGSSTGEIPVSLGLGFSMKIKKASFDVSSEITPEYDHGIVLGGDRGHELISGGF